MSLQAIPLFNALIRRGIDDRGLYWRAMDQVREPGLKVLLRENAQTLDLLVGELQDQVRRRGGLPATHGTLLGSLRGVLADFSAARAGEYRDTVWVRCLARSECSLLDRMQRDAQRTSDGGDAAQVLQRQLGRLHRIHLDMHCLAGTTHT